MCVEWFIHSEGRGHGKQERDKQGQGRDIVVPQRNEPLLHTSHQPRILRSDQHDKSHVVFFHRGAGQNKNPE